MGPFAESLRSTILLNPPIVSAIVPTRNRPEQVCEAVNSALHQTFGNIEVIVIVDGPDAATFEKLSQIHDPRLRVIANEVNRGLGYSRNRGIQAARGQWIALLDDDDEWLPFKLDQQLRLADPVNSDLGVVFSRFVEKDRTFERVLPKRMPVISEDLSEYIYCSRGFLQPSTFLATRKLMLTVPFSEERHIPEDTDWLLRAVKQLGVRFAVVEEPLSIYNNTSDESRLGIGGPWQPLFTWGVANRGLFTRRAFTLFMTKQVALKAKANREGLRVLICLLLVAWGLGKFTLSSLGYFLGYICLPAETRARMREFADRLMHKNRSKSADCNRCSMVLR